MPRKPITQDEDAEDPHYIAEWAAAKNANQAEVARLADVGPPAVSKWFKGGAIEKKSRVTLARAWGIPPFALYMPPEAYELVRHFLTGDPITRRQMANTLSAAFSPRLPAETTPVPRLNKKR